MMSNPHSRFNQLWSAPGWKVRRHRGQAACWGNDGSAFFRTAWHGSWCGRNWYAGSPGGVGEFNGGPDKEWVWPHFRAPAAALLGFDESIDFFCSQRGGGGGHADRCVEVNHNILSLHDGTYNTCRNLEWQVCAARGYLPGQMSRDIRFAFRPGELVPEYIGACTGYHPAGCGEQGYASYDIFYLEVCMYSTMCSNREELFQLQVGDTWRCELDEDGFTQLTDWVLGQLS